MLTKQQQQHFEVFGFVVLQQLFSPDEMAIIIHDFEAAMLEDRDGKPFDGKIRQQVNDWFLGRPCAELLIDSERIYVPIEQLLGPGYTFKQGNDGNFYVGDTVTGIQTWGGIRTFRRVKATLTETRRGSGGIITASEY